MSASDPSYPKLHDLAKAEIDAWRGRCLNIFARGEKAVTDCITGALVTSPEFRLEPLAGQRLNTLEKLAEKHSGTEAQKVALSKAIIEWRRNDEKRPFFSHGVATELLDRKGLWHLRLDFIAIQKGKSEPRRLTLSKVEAEELEKSLHAAFKTLSGQLGQFRKHVAP